MLLPGTAVAFFELVLSVSKRTQLLVICSKQPALFVLRNPVIPLIS